MGSIRRLPLRGFSGSEQWIARLCPNGFGGSIFMDWAAPSPWNTHLSIPRTESHPFHHLEPPNPLIRAIYTPNCKTR